MDRYRSAPSGKDWEVILVISIRGPCQTQALGQGKHHHSPDRTRLWEWSWHSQSCCSQPGQLQRLLHTSCCRAVLRQGSELRAQTTPALTQLHREQGCFVGNAVLGEPEEQNLNFFLVSTTKEVSGPAAEALSSEPAVQVKGSQEHCPARTCSCCSGCAQTGQRAQPLLILLCPHLPAIPHSSTQIRRLHEIQISLCVCRCPSRVSPHPWGCTGFQAETRPFYSVQSSLSCSLTFHTSPQQSTLANKPRGVNSQGKSCKFWHHLGVLGDFFWMLSPALPAFLGGSDSLLPGR